MPLWKDHGGCFLEGVAVFSVSCAAPAFFLFVTLSGSTPLAKGWREDDLGVDLSLSYSLFFSIYLFIYIEL